MTGFSKDRQNLKKAGYVVAQDGTEEAVDPLQAQVVESSKENRNLLIFSMAFFTYVFIATASTTDLKLLMTDSKFNLPVLTVEVPLNLFYIWAPLAIVICHFNMLLNLIWHSRKLYHWVDCNVLMEDVQENELYTFPFVFNYRLMYSEYLIGSRIIRFGTFIIYIIYPVATLIFTELKFIPNHNHVITIWHDVLISVDAIVSMFILWPMVIKPVKTWEIKFSDYCKSYRGSCISLLIIVIIIILLAPVPYIDSIIRSANIDDIFIFHRNLKIRDKILVEKEPGDAIYNAYMIINKPHNKDEKDKMKTEALIDYTPRRNLKKRDFRFADFSRSKFINADLIDADFREAFLKDVNFQGADLTGAKFQGADLTGANFQGAKFYSTDLLGAKIQSENLTRTNFQGAKLTDAKFQGVDLPGANFQGANLWIANFQGANLSSANFQGADLPGAHFQGANLWIANFQGAALKYAEFHGANLSSAKFQGADLTDAHFQGANLRIANFQGADLTGTDFQGATMVNAVLSLAYFMSTHLGCAHLDGAKSEGFFSDDHDKAIDTKEPADWDQIIAQFKENNLDTKRIEDARSYCKKWPDSFKMDIKAKLGKSNGEHVDFMRKFICENKYAAKDIIFYTKGNNTNTSLATSMKKTCPESYEETSGERFSHPGK